MSKHTPGPWEMCGMSVCDKDGDPIAHMAMPASDAGMAAVMQDARLIAAAPEMAEVLEAMDMVLYDMACVAAGNSANTQLFSRMTDARKRAHTLLARIRGETP